MGNTSRTVLGHHPSVGQPEEQSRANEKQQYQQDGNFGGDGISKAGQGEFKLRDWQRYWEADIHCIIQGVSLKLRP